MKPSDRIFVALDLTDEEEARSLARRLMGHVGGFKLGLEFFSANGPDAVRAIVDTGLKVFLDLKFHDIPNTVAGAVRAATATGVSILNVHASGGLDMMRAAAEAAAVGAELHGVSKPIIAAVTVLTSMDTSDLDMVGQRGPADEQVGRLAQWTKDAGLDGVVCSPVESAVVRDAFGDDFVRIVPGIRPSWALTDDQKRITTPRQALDAGATYLVIGRPITQADDPVEAAFRIADEIAE
ncbi:MAG: orotidine-5'-phosphate decarboxylase [Pseudomonadota bacterium]|nr:orotidine-5'-phosphate decarboxylase [Pseudomonadota bacterium]